MPVRGRVCVCVYGCRRERKRERERERKSAAVEALAHKKGDLVSKPFSVTNI